MTTLTTALAAERIITYAAEGRLIQHSWHDDGGGRDLACLLGAIDPSIDDPGKCPASVMPAWLAHMLPTVFDGLPNGRMLDRGLTFGKALREAAAWTPARWDDARDNVLIGIVEIAMSATTDKRTLAACRGVIDAIRSRDAEKLKEANEDAEDAARAAARAAAAAEAEDAAWAEAEAAGAARAAAAAAAAAARAADWAAAAAAAAAAEAAAEAARAEADAYLTIMDMIINELNRNY
jgi:hypothetical protein